MSGRNLDLECALAAGSIAKQLSGNRDVKKQDLEGLYTNASAVLAESGPYAMFLYLWARRDKDKGVSEVVRRQLYQQVCQAVGGSAANIAGPAMLESVAKLSEDFNRLLLVKRVLSQTLAYLRYHAKAFAPDKPAKRKEAAT